MAKPPVIHQIKIGLSPEEREQYDEFDCKLRTFFGLVLAALFLFDYISKLN